MAWVLAAWMIALPGTAEGRHYPRLFGSIELHSAKLSRFPHWLSMLERFREESRGCDSATCRSGGWNELISGLKSKSRSVQIREVNKLLNAHRYVVDDENWSSADYWATPYEFLKKSGDCEDFAISKYMALRALGVPVADMRVVALWNIRSNSGHAVLVVYDGADALLLDNLNPVVV